MALTNAPSWKPFLDDELNQPYMLVLKEFLRIEKNDGKTIYPHSANWFHALEACPLNDVKVVILGQDPYHQPHQAHGLCFSVQPDVKIPPSLLNIYKELHADLGIPYALHGCLESWAKQGVLLLNSVLTVEYDKPNAHQGKGWETFTDKIIHTVAEQNEHVVFLLWGNYAQKKGAFIDEQQHLVLKAPHPSPLSAHRGFLGCRHFSQTNHYLQQHNIPPIHWELPKLAAPVS
ncbi:MAG: uracil-DNA glycosylase [Cycloclasticus pugetii]|jgi:uracil-DNA glycosylase|uniref:Uracil-DNA glycosylase n=2 Tax=Cycloclasticus TaxID=34067 RepID=S5T9Y7_9GAMM|nr:MULTISPECIES: uracil-DNA glycosylase [Cycloclasticus]AFT66585.1 Uracil-DNA glycosylase [Cycloclasticus sp. P1]AGS40374.1 Uracil-DNA glycosylase [Cycloclasticus zancles 78-ME]ATI03842.1 uracil-DNA glycosylase [Cycloclasticus sp. PY97N]EPD14275.1 uracil-DNA glycosylase [Cycloclasticus pugetii]MBV1898859.1 uracil-DNA glycosylase [Cycloclasticus sp.]